MNILQISDLHFGARHWGGNDEKLLCKINSYPADLVINTGDNTTDGLESEYQDAGQFLKGITCENVISIAGNHDKRNLRAHEYFRKYIDLDEVILPSRPELTTKKDIYLQKDITKTENHFTDLNYVKLLTINGMTVLVICIDSNILYEDEGYVEKEILRSISREINGLKYDKSMMLIHHSILTMDSEPLRNSFHVTDFVREHKIEDVFCGHTHRLYLRKSTDLYFKNSFTQYMVGSLSTSNLMGNDNQFLYLENWGTPEMRTHFIRILLNDGVVSFTEELI
ncbi:MAG: metallophosphoesterase [Desulfobacterales bacterium]|nr:metallophosphoesterase [Desulfobacterales bacterium]